VGCSSQNTIYSADNAYYLFTISQGDVITGTTTSSLVITNNQTVTNCATKLETESSVQLISVLSTTGFTVCDKTILTGLGGLRNILP
jgi:hypothetical protein